MRQRLPESYPGFDGQRGKRYALIMDGSNDSFVTIATLWTMLWDRFTLQLMDKGKIRPLGKTLPLLRMGLQGKPHVTAMALLVGLCQR